MKWMMSCVLCAALTTWSALDANRAAAQSTFSQPSTPAACNQRDRLRTKYSNGLQAGRQKADNLFAAADVGRNPQKLQKKLNRVLTRLGDHLREVTQSESEKEGRRCRVQGVADGFIVRLAELLGQCILDGAQWGQFTAQLYCELSLELGGLAEGTLFTRAPAGLCGGLFEFTCDDVYSYIASEAQDTLDPIVQRFISERGLSVAPYPGCGQFTRAQYASVFQSAQQTDCAYVLP